MGPPTAMPISTSNNIISLNNSVTEDNSLHLTEVQHSLSHIAQQASDNFVSSHPHGLGAYYTGPATGVGMRLGANEESARGFFPAPGHFHQQPTHYPNAFDDGRISAYKCHHSNNHHANYGGYFPAPHSRTAPYPLPHMRTAFDHSTDIQHSGFYPDYHNIAQYASFDR